MTRRSKPIVVQRGGGGYTPPPPALPVAGLGRLRKIAIIGSAETVEYAPWHDPTWEIWSHAITFGRCKRVDRVFEMHPAHVWRDHEKPQWPTYLKWLQRCPYPVYMLEKHGDIPTSVRYPRERIFGECRSMIGRLHFGSQADFMIALALSEGVTHLGFFGVQYTATIREGDRNEQLLSFKFWIGVAAGKGVSIVLPEGHTTFKTPAEVYGLESHSTPEKYAARLQAERAVPGKDGDAQPLVPAKGPMKPPPPDVVIDETHDQAKARWDQYAGVGA